MAEPEDPIADQIDPQPATPVPMPAAAPRRPALIGPVIGGVLAAAIGFAVAQFVPGGWPIADTAALEAKLTTQAEQTQALQTALAALSEAPTAPDSVLTDRIASLESTVSALPPAPDTTSLDQRLAALEQRLTVIEALPKAGSPASAAALAQLQSDVAALKSGGPSAAALQQASAAIDAKLAGAESKIAAIKREAEATTQAAAIRTAVGQIAAALDSGAPYSAALAVLTAANLPPILTDNAKTGLPSQQSLTAGFPDAARAALAASLPAAKGQSWTERASAFLRNQTGARSLTPHPGNDPDAVLSRAEAALNAGDLATVLTELAALPPEGQAAIAAWQAECARRQAGILAVQSLSATLGG